MNNVNIQTTMNIENLVLVSRLAGHVFSYFTRIQFCAPTKCRKVFMGYEFARNSIFDAKRVICTSRLMRELTLAQAIKWAFSNPALFVRQHITFQIGDKYWVERNRKNINFEFSHSFTIYTENWLSMICFQCCTFHANYKLQISLV